MPLLPSSLWAVTTISIAMLAVAALETAIPLHPRNRSHIAPNLALTALTFATNLAMNVPLAATLAWLGARRFGILPWLCLPPVIAGVLAVVVLDFSFYVAHRAMHAFASLWRYHGVHHSDVAVDVTTTIRQHPGESLIRYAFLSAFAIGFGASPAAFAVYRIWSALHGLAEHANIRVPERLDTLLSSVVSTPNMHKIHHSRRQELNDTNYSNLFVFDRLFGTFTPSRLGVAIEYGVDGLDDVDVETAARLLALPFRHARETSEAARVT